MKGASTLRTDSSMKTISIKIAVRTTQHADGHYNQINYVRPSRVLHSIVLSVFHQEKSCISRTSVDNVIGTSLA